MKPWQQWWKTFDINGANTGSHAFSVTFKCTILHILLSSLDIHMETVMLSQIVFAKNCSSFLSFKIQIKFVELSRCIYILVLDH